MKYIQRKDYQFRTLETVDECETLKEARYLVNEYGIADHSARYYISSRPCKAWRAELETVNQIT